MNLNIWVQNSIISISLIDCNAFKNEKFQKENKIKS